MLNRREFIFAGTAAAVSPAFVQGELVGKPDLKSKLPSMKPKQTPLLAVRGMFHYAHIYGNYGGRKWFPFVEETKVGQIINFLLELMMQHEQDLEDQGQSWRLKNHDRVYGNVNIRINRHFTDTLEGKERCIMTLTGFKHSELPHMLINAATFIPNMLQGKMAKAIHIYPNPDQRYPASWQWCESEGRDRRKGCGSNGAFDTAISRLRMLNYPVV